MYVPSLKPSNRPWRPKGLWDVKGFHIIGSSRIRDPMKFLMSHYALIFTQFVIEMRIEAGKLYGRCVRLSILSPSVSLLSRQCEILNIFQSCGPPRPVAGIALLYFLLQSINTLKKTNKQKNSVALSPQANYTDWATATCQRHLVPTFVDRVVSRGQLCGSPTVVNLKKIKKIISGHLYKVQGYTWMPWLISTIGMGLEFWKLKATAGTVNTRTRHIWHV
jgi:hypothetical protein